VYLGVLLCATGRVHTTHSHWLLPPRTGTLTPITHSHSYSPRLTVMVTRIQPFGFGAGVTDNPKGSICITNGVTGGVTMLELTIAELTTDGADYCIRLS